MSGYLLKYFCNIWLAPAKRLRSKICKILMTIPYLGGNKNPQKLKLEVKRFLFSRCCCMAFHHDKAPIGGESFSAMFSLASQAPAEFCKPDAAVGTCAMCSAGFSGATMYFSAVSVPIDLLLVCWIFQVKQNGLMGNFWTSNLTCFAPIDLDNKTSLSPDIVKLKTVLKA